MAEFFGSAASNYLNPGAVDDLWVFRGKNLVNTCLQYAVLDDESLRILNINVYEKTVEMVACKALHFVDTRINALTGPRNS